MKGRLRLLLWLLPLLGAVAETANSYISEHPFDESKTKKKWHSEEKES